MTSDIEAQVGWLHVGDDAVSFDAVLAGGAARAGEVALVGVRPRDGARVHGDAARVDGRVAVRLAFAALPDSGRYDRWELFLEVPEPVRLVKRLEGVEQMADVLAFRAVRAGARVVRPRFDRGGGLTVASWPARDDAPAPPAPALTLPPPPRRQIVAHRLALRLVAPLLRPALAEPPPGPPPVTILVMDAHVMSGVTRSVLHLAEHLAATHDVEVVSVVAERPRPFFALPPEVRFSAIERRHDPRAPAGWRGRLRELLAARRGRLLHPTDQAAAKTTLWTDLLLARRLRTLRGVLVTTRPALNIVAARLSRPGLACIAQEHVNLGRRGATIQPDIRRAYARLDAVAVLTEADRRRYERALGGRGRVVAIPNAVRPPRGERSALTAPIALAAGRLTPQKGFDRLIPAFAALAREEPDWTLRIAGTGRMGRVLREQIVAHDASNSIHMLGRVRDMAAQMRLASMFVLSSRWEGFPMVLIEAMSSGLPVVAFDCPTGPADVVEDGVNGFLVADGDHDALVAAMLSLARDEGLRRRLGAAAAARAADYTTEVVGRRWDALISELVR